jgi:hypothetical protein
LQDVVSFTERNAVDRRRNVVSREQIFGSDNLADHWPVEVAFDFDEFHLGILNGPEYFVAVIGKRNDGFLVIRFFQPMSSMKRFVYLLGQSL